MAFGGVIKLQGESEYRKALSDITNSLKVVGSELKKVSSLYDKNDNSVEKLSSTNETLTKKLKLQNDALDKARDMLKEAQEYTNIIYRPWLLTPGFLIFVAVLAFNVIGDTIRDVLDPKSNK